MERGDIKKKEISKLGNHSMKPSVIFFHFGKSEN